MATPRGEYWRNPGEVAWRKTATDAPPAPPTVVEWLAWPGTSRRSIRRPSLAQFEADALAGERPTIAGPQLP
jgi:hypothetical protein